MNYKISLFIFFYLLCGCTASMVVEPGNTSSKYAPINEKKRPGIIKYLNAGAEPVIKARREDAYRQMYDTCGGKYKILNEGLRSEDGMIVPVGKGAMYLDSQYIYIQFECINENAE